MNLVAFPKTNLQPALSIASVYAKLDALGFHARDIRALLEHTEFPSIPFRSHQICFMHAWTEENLERPIPTMQLAEIFEVTERTVRRTLSTGPQEPEPLGRHRAVDQESETALVRVILDAHRGGKSLTPKEVLRIVREKHDPKLTKGWVNAFIGRNLDAIKVCRSFPQEDSRLTIPREILDAHIRNIHSTVVGKCAELVFNLDEVGSSEWEERKVRKVLVPAPLSPDEVFHSVSRRYSHVTLLACVSAAGDALTPMVISGMAIQDSLWQNGLRQDEDAMIRSRTPAYIDSELFYEYISTVLVPYIDNVRRNPALADEPAVLLMDSALPHVSERVLQLLGQRNIIALVFPAHTTNLFQALDLVFFGALKKLKQTTAGEYDERTMNAQITKLIHAYEQTATSFTIRGSFRRAGITSATQVKPFRLRFDEATLRENPGFREIWERNISIDELSKRRRGHRFGVINEEFLPR